MSSTPRVVVSPLRSLDCFINLCSVDDCTQRRSTTKNPKPKRTIRTSFVNQRDDEDDLGGGDGEDPPPVPEV